MSQQSPPSDQPSRRSIRLKEYDYSQSGSYFVTLCTKRKACLFGNVENGVVLLSEIGSTAEERLIGISKHFPFVSVDEHVIMPNHVHGIIVIQPVGAALMPPEEKLFSTGQDSTPRSLSFIIQQHKSGVTRWCAANGFGYFGWQRGFLRARNQERGRFTRYQGSTS